MTYIGRDRVVAVPGRQGFGISEAGSVSPVILENCLFVAKNGVDSSGQRNNLSKPFLTIQAAVNASQAGDAIFVLNGIYNESLTINKAVNLIYSAGTIKQWVTYIEATGVKVIGHGASLGNYIGRANFSYEIIGGVTGGITVNNAVCTVTNSFVDDVTISTGGTMNIYECTGRKMILSDNTEVNIRSSNFDSGVEPTIVGLSTGHKVKAENSSFESTGDYAIKNTKGILQLHSCLIKSSATLPIQFSQALAGSQAIKGCTLLGVGATCIDFTGNALYSKMLLDGNSSNLPFPVNSQIIEGFNLYNNNLS